MTKITDRMLKFSLMIKTQIVTNHTFFAAVTFSKTNSTAYVNFFGNIALIRFNLNQFQKNCYQDNLLFSSLRFY